MPPRLAWAILAEAPNWDNSNDFNRPYCSRSARATNIGCSVTAACFGNCAVSEAIYSAPHYNGETRRQNSKTNLTGITAAISMSSVRHAGP
jgi:hypothetical protein